MSFGQLAGNKPSGVKGEYGDLARTSWMVVSGEEQFVSTRYW